MTIRHATPDDLPHIMRLIDHGRNTMRQNGNHAQWTDGYLHVFVHNVSILRNNAGNAFLFCGCDKKKTTDLRPPSLNLLQL